MFRKLKCAFSVALLCAGSVFADEEVKVSSFGNNVQDATEFFQKALDSGAKRVVVDRVGSPYIVRPLFVRSNTSLIFEEGVQVLAKAGEFRDRFDALFTLHGVTNVMMRGLGKGATLKMRIKDYQAAPYLRGEWRHAVNLLSVRDVTIDNLVLADSGGDGVYVGAKPSNIPCRNVVIRDCICDNNNRQGISVISADGLLIERTVMKNTQGTAPRAGIDFEPNSARQVLKRIVMRDCLTENNFGSGYEMYPASFDSRSEPVDITFENCRSVGDGYCGIKIARAGSVIPKYGYPSGTIRVKNCTFTATRGPNVHIANKPAGVWDVIFENCRFERKENNLSPNVRFVTDNRNFKPTDGVTFINSTVVRAKSEGWFVCSQMPWSPVDMENVKGEITLECGSAKKQLVLDEAWRKSVFKFDGVKYVLDNVAFNAGKIGRIVDNRPGESVALEPIIMRFLINARVYAAKPGPVTFVPRLCRINKQSMEKAVFTVKDMKGKVVAKLPAAEETPSPRTFTAPEAGFYSITCDLLRNGVMFTACDAPIGFLPDPRFKINIYKSRGNLYFAHTEGTDESLFCGGTGEPATITLFNPSGREFGSWKNQALWGAKRIAPEDAEGLWRINIAQPSCSGWEDTMADRTGMPPVFFLSKEKYWFSSK